MVAQPVAERRLDLFPRQHRFVLDPARFPWARGGIGSGKSFTLVAKIIPRIDKEQIGMVAAPTYPMLRDATQRTLLAVLNDLGIGYRHYKTDKIVTIPASRHEITLRSCEDEETLRGPNLHYAAVDEVSLISEAAWKIIKGRVRLGHNPQAWAAGTPKGKRHWTYREWVVDANPNHPMYVFATRENPLLPPDFADELGYTGRFAEQELEGGFVGFEGLVYENFDRRTHVRDVDCSGWPAVVGVDRGTNNPTAILTVRHSGDARHVEREVYRRGMGATEILAAVQAEADACGAEAVYVDPSSADLIRDLDLAGYPVHKAVNRVVDGIAEVTARLADGLTVSPSCVNTIAEFESYAYPDGNRSAGDVPVKQNDHSMDALRYSLMGLAAPKAEVYVY